MRSATVMVHYEGTGFIFFIILMKEKQILTLYINHIDTVAVRRHQNLHRQDFTLLAAYVITGNTVIAVPFHSATV